MLLTCHFDRWTSILSSLQAPITGHSKRRFLLLFWCQTSSNFVAGNCFHPLFSFQQEQSSTTLAPGRAMSLRSMNDTQVDTFLRIYKENTLMMGSILLVTRRTSLDVSERHSAWVEQYLIAELSACEQLHFTLTVPLRLRLKHYFGSRRLSELGSAPRASITAITWWRFTFITWPNICFHWNCWHKSH